MAKKRREVLIMTNKLTFTAYDGKTITYREWLCDNPKGIIQISHGMAESGDRYTAFAEFMNERGFIVVADDHRGHGETDPGRTGYSEGDMWNGTLKDLAALNKIYREKYPELPYVIFGHSYGSFLTQRYIELYGDTVDAAVIGGSAYLNDFSVVAARFVAKWNCFFGKGDKPAELIKKLSFDKYNKIYDDGTTFISQLPEECGRYEQAFDCNFTLSNNFYKSFFSGLPKTYKAKNYSKIPSDLPLLLVAGDGDPVGGYGKLMEKLYRFYKEKVGVKSVKKVIYPKVRHEYLNDTSREAVKKEIADFAESIKKRV